MGATFGKIAREILSELLQNLLGSFLPAPNIAVPDWIWIGIFGLLMIPLAWGRISAFSEQQRVAATQ